MPHLIKRYSNRKLYDTTTSRYVTLLEISALVRTGETIEVVDNRSHQNITGQTLAQSLTKEVEMRPHDPAMVERIKVLLQESSPPAAVPRRSPDESLRS